jgi:hypothetical protein
MRIRIRHPLGTTMVILAALLLGACNPVPPKALFFDSAAWPENMEQIALVEVSYDRRYRPPPGLDLTAELRRALKQELTRKGYQLLLADRGEEIYQDEASAAELTERAPQEADAVLALHIDFLILPVNLWERNPPPEAEIAGEARLVSKVGRRELWRGRGDGQAGGAAALPVVYALPLRQEALTDLMRKLFATLPDRR